MPLASGRIRSPLLSPVIMTKLPLFVMRVLSLLHVDLGIAPHPTGGDNKGGLT